MVFYLASVRITWFHTAFPILFRLSYGKIYMIHFGLVWGFLLEGNYGPGWTTALLTLSCKSFAFLLHFFLFVVFNPMLYVTRKRHMTSLALKWSNGYKFPDCYSLINISIKWFTQKVEKEISLHPLRKLMYETGLPCCLILAFYIKGKLASVNSFMSAHVCFTEHNFLLTSYGDQFLSNKNVRAEGLPWRSSG